VQPGGADPGQPLKCGSSRTDLTSVMPSETATQTAPPNAYQRTQVLTANPEQLRLLLLEGAVRFTRQGREAIEKKDYEAIYTGFTKARDIVVELMTAIRPDTEPTLRSKVQGLYGYIFRLLMDASFEKDVAKADEAIKLLDFECETWKLAMEKLKAERSHATARSAQATHVERPALSIQG
jgi:flagellar protein FliS